MNIAVFLPGWVGDAVMATAAVRALRGRYPTSKMIAVGKPYVAPVLEGSEWFDEIMPYNSGKWSDGVIATAYRLRRRKIDLAVLFPNSFRSALIARLAGCRKRIGFARHGRSCLLSTSLEPRRDGKGRLVPSPILDDYNRLAQAAGCTVVDRQLELHTTPGDEHDADLIWEFTGLGQFSEVICLNPGGAFGSAKHWPIEHFASLGRRLASKRGAGVLVLCGPAERAMSHEIARRTYDGRVFGLADFLAPSRGDGPALSLGLIKALVRRADLLVTTDSGPRHFAAAFGRPVVTLFGPTHIDWTETYHPQGIHLQKKVDCGPCQLRVCPLDHRCMRGLNPDEVFLAVEKLLGVKANHREIC